MDTPNSLPILKQWNTVVVLDPTGFSDEDRKYFDDIEATANRVGVACQRGWSLAPPEVSNVILVAHRRCDLRDDLLKWKELGHLRGRYLMLYVCGEKGEPPLTPEELKALQITGSIFPGNQILIKVVASHLDFALPSLLQKSENRKNVTQFS